MIRRHLLVALLGLTTITTACHHAKPPAPPAPVTNPPPPSAPDTTLLHQQHLRDQAAAAQAAAAQKAHDDSVAAAAALANGQRAAMATITDMIHFDYNKADISPDDARKLDAKIALMRARPALRIRITGNCDERGSDAYNIALGTSRAAAAKEYLVKAGIDASRIEVSTLGREKPLDPGHNEAAWAKNRRDEFEVIAGQQTLGRL